MSAPEFVPLAALLHPPVPRAEQPALPTAATAAASARDDDGDDAVQEALAAARRFRARLSDACDAAIAQVRRDLTVRVLARELALAPCDLAAIVAQVRATLPVVRVRVALEDAQRDFGLPVLVDAALQPGDVLLEVAGGVVDARLGVRAAQLVQGR